MEKLKIVQGEKESNKKWGVKAMSLGYVQFPTLLLQRQRELGLSPVDLNIILHIISYWWRYKELPFPSKRTIADALDLDASTIRRRIAALEKVGLIKREKRLGSNSGCASNRYNLEGLVRKLQLIAQKESSHREAKKTIKGRRSLKIVSAQNKEVE